MDAQFGGTRGAQNDADALLVNMREGAFGRIFQNLLRNHHAQELAGIGVLDRIGRHAVGHGIKGDRVHKGARLAIGFVLRSGIGIIVILDQPMLGRDFPNLIAPFHHIAPEAAGIGRAGKECANADNGDGRGGRFTVFVLMTHRAFFDPLGMRQTHTGRA